MPAPLLKNMVLSGLQTHPSDDLGIVNASDFMADRLETLSHAVLASRLFVNSNGSFVRPNLVRDCPITVIDVFDESALSDDVKRDVYKCHPQAKPAHLKSGGNFPFLSRSEEVNLHILVIYDTTHM